jgi:hypothetical protein
MKWAHLLCAMWIPEVSLGNATFQEPVQDVEKVPKTRWKLVRFQDYSLHEQLTDYLLVVLHLQTEDGSVYPMRPQVMFRSLSCHMCTKG